MNTRQQDDLGPPWGQGFSHKSILVTEFSLSPFQTVQVWQHISRTHEFMPTRGNPCRPVLWPLLEAVTLLLSFCPNSVPAWLLHLEIPPFKVLLTDV